MTDRPLPSWARLIIAFTLLTILGGYAGGLTLLVELKRLVKEASDPGHIKQVAAYVAQFPDPLPAGYQFINGVHVPSLFTMDVITIEHEPDKQQIAFQCADSPVAEDPKKLLDGALDQPVNTLTAWAKFQDMKYMGNTQVASEPMPYIVGDTIDMNGKKARGMVGCVQRKIKDGVKRIFIYALQTSDVPYNQQITMNLLNSIKSF